MKALLAFIGVLVLLPGIFVYSTFAYGFALHKGWEWFSPAMGINFPLSVQACMGIYLLSSVFKTGMEEKIKDDDMKVRIIISLLAPWMMVLVFWLFTFLI